MRGKSIMSSTEPSMAAWSMLTTRLILQVAYMGLGSYFGYFVSQNGRGHVLGHVKDLGEDATRPDKVRIYRTNAK